MAMSVIYFLLLLVSFVCAVIHGTGAQLSAAALSGAQTGITVTLSIAGSICLWSGFGRLLEQSGIADFLAKVLQPVLYRIFPSSRRDDALRRDLSGNVCANLLGLGNAATPLGIRAAKRMVSPLRHGEATDEMCRLIVMNTASIQLIPASVAALRGSCGAAHPFDILLPVWITSLCSVTAGLCAAGLFARTSRG